MHVLIADDWLDHDYIDRSHARLRAAAGARRAVPAGARRADLRHRRTQVIVDLARALRRDPEGAIRLNYGMQRVRGGGNAVRRSRCLPCLTGAWRERAGGVLLSSSGWTPVDSQRARAARPAAGLAVEAAAHRST